jgi:hypothetical protein
LFLSAVDFTPNSFVFNTSALPQASQWGASSSAAVAVMRTGEHRHVIMSLHIVVLLLQLRCMLIANGV